MRRAVLALVVTVVAVVLLARYDTHPPAARGLDNARERRAAARAAERRAPTEEARASGSRRGVSGSGPATTTPFSVIRVEATVSHGRLVGVRTLALSGDGPHTEALNAHAEPILRREALRAGSARVDAVSGATYTSEAWSRSLRQALRVARAREERLRSSP